MNYFVCFFIVLCFCSRIYAQKPPIDSSVYGKWPSVKNAFITDNGKYAEYFKVNQPIGGGTTVLISTDGRWKMEIPTLTKVDFTKDSRWAIFLDQNSRLQIIELGKSWRDSIANVNSYKIFGDGSGQWLGYNLKSSKKLVLANLGSKDERVVDSVVDYWGTDDGMIALLVAHSVDDQIEEKSLCLMNLINGNVTTIWRGFNAQNVVFDSGNRQLAFIGVEKLEGKESNSIWYYKYGQNRAVVLANDRSTGIDKDVKVGYISSFSKDGKKIFFTLVDAAERPTPQPEAVPVVIWSYQDQKLQSEQAKEKDRTRDYLASISIKDHSIIRQEYSGEYLQMNGYSFSDDLALISKLDGDPGWGEVNWNPASQGVEYLVFMKDNTRKKIGELDGFRLNNFNISPMGKYVVFFNSYQRDYYSYEIATGIVRNITKGMRTKWLIFGNDMPDSSLATNGLAGWLKGDSAILLYDQYDIWEVDLAGRRAAVNLTNGYGFRYSIFFRLMQPQSGAVLESNQSILLYAFNRKTKANGFYRTMVKKGGEPELLTMGPYVYCVPFDYGESPIKARNVDAWLVKRMSASRSPNYFFTTDFKTFAPLSDIHPEENYNWLFTELLSWKTLDGKLAQGVLYKPENFDPRKKYPVIFYYYQRLSDRLNLYEEPEPCAGSLDIPWFVSNGYLVFTPDIQYKIGAVGSSVINSVVPAAEYLRKMPWVDGLKMGLQGHSFGAYETNYLITHTHLFAAACSASGIADLISAYGSLNDNGGSEQGMYEIGQNRMGSTPWQDPLAYIRNSPLFGVENVTTPLLMMHTTNDGVYRFANALEFFTALRRLKKKVWMLQYNDGNHFVEGSSAADFSVRIEQFFDYYLKGGPLPKWMSEGVPAKAEKGQ